MLVPSKGLDLLIEGNKIFVSFVMTNLLLLSNTKYKDKSIFSLFSFVYSKKYSCLFIFILKLILFSAEFLIILFIILFNKENLVSLNLEYGNKSMISDIKSKFSFISLKNSFKEE